MRRDPTVSVCIPAYNHAKYVRRTLESVLQQDFHDFEIVITDDCSTDGTAEEILAVRDDRIRLFRHPRNMGPSIAANNNIRQARGAFISIVPSDDLFEPHKLSRQLEEFRRHPSLGATFSFMQRMDEDGVPLPDTNFGVALPPDWRRESVLRHFFFEGNCLAAPTAMMRREAVRKTGLFDPRLLQTQDYDYWVRLCLRFDISVVEEKLVGYRIRAQLGNLDANTTGKAARIQWELAKVLQGFGGCGDRGLLLRAFPELSDHFAAGLGIWAAMGLLAVQAPQHWTRVFGIETLYRELGEEEGARQLEAAGLDIPRFYRLLAEVDPARAGAGGEVRQQLEEMRAYLTEVLAARDWHRAQAERWEAQFMRATGR